MCCMYGCLCAPVCVYVCIYLCMCVGLYVCIYVCMCECACCSWFVWVFWFKQNLYLRKVKGWRQSMTYFRLPELFCRSSVLQTESTLCTVPWLHPVEKGLWLQPPKQSIVMSTAVPCCQMLPWFFFYYIHHMYQYYIQVCAYCAVSQYCPWLENTFQILDRSIPAE